MRRVRYCSSVQWFGCGEKNDERVRKSLAPVGAVLKFHMKAKPLLNTCRLVASLYFRVVRFVAWKRGLVQMDKTATAKW